MYLVVLLSIGFVFSCCCTNQFKGLKSTHTTGFLTFNWHRLQIIIFIICRHYHYRRLLLHYLLHFHFYWNCQCHLGNSGRGGIKVFQIEDSTTFARLSRIWLMFNLKTMAASTSPGLRDNCLGAMASFSPLRSHSDSSQLLTNFIQLTSLT